MGSGVRTFSIAVAIYNTLCWILNWAMIGIYIHHFWKSEPLYAALLLFHVFLSNASMISVFTTVSGMAMHDDLESGHPERPGHEEITIHRHVSRDPPPFWSELMEPEKAV